MTVKPIEQEGSQFELIEEEERYIDFHFEVIRLRYMDAKREMVRELVELGLPADSIHRILNCESEL